MLPDRYGSTERTKLITQNVLVKKFFKQGWWKSYSLKKAKVKLENGCIQLKSHF